MKPLEGLTIKTTYLLVMNMMWSTLTIMKFSFRDFRCVQPLLLFLLSIIFHVISFILFGFKNFAVTTAFNFHSFCCIVHFVFVYECVCVGSPGKRPIPYSEEVGQQLAPPP